jgi:hypothetical protein
MNKVIALVDGCSDRCLHSVTLEPRFTVRCVNLGVSSEEWIESTKLIELNIQIISNFAIESGNVATTIRVTADTKLKNHIDRALHFCFGCCVVASPVSAKLLRAKVEASSQNEWSSLVSISSKETSPGTPLLKCTISVVQVTVLKAATASFPVSHIEGHRVRISTENRRFIHIVPEVVEVARSWEVLISELLTPV